MSEAARHGTSLVPFMSLIPIFIAVMSQKARRELIERLRTRGAIDAAHAVPLGPLKRLEQNWLKRLEAMDIVRSTGDERYYYNEAVVDSRRQSQVRIIPLLLIIVAAGIGIATAIVLLGHGRS